MGKIRTRILGMEDVEKQQKDEQKKRSEEKKLKRMTTVEADEESLKKMEKAKQIMQKTHSAQKSSVGVKEKAKKKIVSVKSRGKKYKEAKQLVDKTKSYLLEDAVDLLKKMKISKLDESVELHINVDEVGLKGELDLPHSTGKTVKVAVVNDELLANIEKGKLDFDVLVTHPSFMPKLAKFAKVLGPKGLMPNPKAGTISTNPEEVVKKFSKGLLRWKTEAKFPLVHQMIGKVSLTDKALSENAKKFMNAVGKQHIQKAVIKSTMSPSIKIDVEKS